MKSEMLDQPRGGWGGGHVHHAPNTPVEQFAYPPHFDVLDFLPLLTPSKGLDPFEGAGKRLYVILGDQMNVHALATQPVVLHVQ